MLLCVFVCYVLYVNMFSVFDVCVCWNGNEPYDYG